MIGITIYDVEDNHKFHQSLELSQDRWLEKLALMDDNRGPKDALCSWIYNKSRKKCSQQQKSRTSLSIVITDSLQFETDNMNEWMPEAKLEPKKWTNGIETALKLVPN